MDIPFLNRILFHLLDLVVYQHIHLLYVDIHHNIFLKLINNLEIFFFPVNSLQFLLELPDTLLCSHQLLFLIQYLFHFVLREDEGKITVYKINENNEEEIYEKTEISVEYLSETDKGKISDGIKVNGIEELNQLLEDFE